MPVDLWAKIYLEAKNEMVAWIVKSFVAETRRELVINQARSQAEIGAVLKAQNEKWLNLCGQINNDLDSEGYKTIVFKNFPEYAGIFIKICAT